MSSSSHPSTSQANESVLGNGSAHIIHFDATQRRKERMRQKSQAAGAPEAPPASASVAAPLPAAPKPNNNGTSHAAAPVVQAAPQPAAATPAPAQPAVAAPAAQPAAATPAPAEKKSGGLSLNREELEKFLIAFVVEQTGYPEEMVELDADLEADLGIDSIKKAQMVAELADTMDIQVEINEDLTLDDFPTLGHVVGFLEQAAVGGTTSETKTSAPTAAPATQAAVAPAAAPVAAPAPVAQPAPVQPAPVQAAQPAPAPVAQPAPVAAQAAASAPKQGGGLALNREELEKFLVSFVVEQTGYPEEMVELDADLEADLGIDSIKKAQMVAELADTMDIQVEINEDLTLDDFPTLGHVVDFLEQAATAGPASEAKAAPPATAPAAQPAATPAPAAAMPQAQPAVATAAPAPVAQPAPVRAAQPAPVAQPAPAPAQQPVAAPVAVAAPTAPAVASAPKQNSGLSLNREEFEKFLVSFVVEQTGYPEEMVELDADLEADLGIDSIKKAQMVAELADTMEIQVEINEDLTLDDFPTLRHVVDFLEQAAVGGTPASAQAS